MPNSYRPHPSSEIFSCYPHSHAPLFPPPSLLQLTWHLLIGLHSYLLLCIKAPDVTTPSTKFAFSRSIRTQHPGWPTNFIGVHPVGQLAFPGLFLAGPGGSVGLLPRSPIHEHWSPRACKLQYNLGPLQPRALPSFSSLSPLSALTFLLSSHKWVQSCGKPSLHPPRGLCPAVPSAFCPPARAQPHLSI